MSSYCSFYTESELKDIGFKSIGQNVLISRKASFYGVEKIEIGDNVRIDDFCFLSGNIKLGNYIHISVGCILCGSVNGILMEDFSGLSTRVIIHVDSDDYSGNSLTNPMIDMEFKNVKSGAVKIRKHVIIGSNSVVLPNVEIGEGSSVGAMSMVTSSIKPWTINVGIPAKRIKERSKELLILEKKFLQKKANF